MCCTYCDNFTCWPGGKVFTKGQYEFRKLRKKITNLTHTVPGAEVVQASSSDLVTVTCLILKVRNMPLF